MSLSVSLTAPEIAGFHAYLKDVQGLEIRLAVAVREDAVLVVFPRMLEDGVEELPMMFCIQRSLEDRQIAVDANKSQRLLPLRRQVGAGHYSGPVAGKAVLVVETQVISLGDHVDAVLAEKDHEQAVRNRL